MPMSVAVCAVAPDAPAASAMAPTTINLFQRASFTVRNPDVLHLRRRAKELAPLAVARVEPVALVPRRPGALHVRRRRQVHCLYAVATPEIPHRVHVVVLGE